MVSGETSWSRSQDRAPRSWDCGTGRRYILHRLQRVRVELRHPRQGGKRPPAWPCRPGELDAPNSKRREYHRQSCG